MLKDVMQIEKSHLRNPIPAVLRLLALLLFIFSAEDALAAKCLLNGQWYDYSSPECSRENSSSGSRGQKASQSNSEAAASSPSQKFLGVGQTGKDGGLIFTLESWSESHSLPKQRGGLIQAKEGGKFAVTRIKFKNGGKASVDIYCKFDLGAVLLDKDGRKFDHIRSLYQVEGNTGCNDNIQPGFSSSETIAFELPTQFKPDYVVFWDPNEISGDGKDSFGEQSSVRFKLRP
jgi:hypothetical protein